MGNISNYSSALLLTMVTFCSTIPNAAQAIDDPAADIAAVGRLLDVRSDAYIQFDSTTRSQWSQKVGSGVEFGFLAGNFDGAGIASTGLDDIAGICFKPLAQGNGHMLVTSSPGDAVGHLWQKALGANDQYTYYVDRGDFNGDGTEDVGAFYHGRNGDSPSAVRMKITYGPQGATQTSYPSSPGQTGASIDWLFPNGHEAGFLPGDYVGQDSIGDVAVVTRSGSNLIANFYRGPNGTLVQNFSWNLGTGTVAALRGCDFNADGNRDIAVILFNSTTGAYSARIVNGPNGTISPTTWDLPYGSGAVKNFLVNDFDNDGKCDIAVAYTTANGNFAFIRYAPDLNRPSETQPLQTDSARQFAFLAGKFGSPIQSQGGCPAGLTVDRCGVCGGDGTSCLGCQTSDLTALLSTTGRELVLLRDLNSRQLTVYRQAGGRNPKISRYVTKQLKMIDTRYKNLIDDIYVQFPSVLLTCSNSIFCSSVNNSVAIARYRSLADQFYRGTLDAAKRMLKITSKKPAVNNTKKRVKRTTSVHSSVLGHIASLPVTASQCTRQ